MTAASSLSCRLYGISKDQGRFLGDEGEEVLEYTYFSTNFVLSPVSKNKHLFSFMSVSEKYLVISLKEEKPHLGLYRKTRLKVTSFKYNELIK
jgi:hypothetical protein